MTEDKRCAAPEVSMFALQMVPFRRMGKPEEIGEMVLFRCDRSFIHQWHIAMTTSMADGA